MRRMYSKEKLVEIIKDNAGIPPELEQQITTNKNDITSLNSAVGQHTVSINNLKSEKQDKLTAGKDIKIEGNTISSTVNPYYNPHEISLIGFTPDAANNTFTVIAYNDVVYADVDWGDGSPIEHIEKQTTHTYTKLNEPVLVVVKGKPSWMNDFPQKNTTYLSIKNRDSTSYKGLSQLKYIDQLDEAAGSWQYKFTDCENLISIGSVNTVGVKTFYGAFQRCKKLIVVPPLNTSSANNFESMFDTCWSLTTIPPIDTSKATSLKSMFENCKNLVSVPPLSTSTVTKFDYMFKGCEVLPSVPYFDTSAGKTFTWMFGWCEKLVKIPAYNLSNGTNLDNMFSLCDNIEEIDAYGMKVKFDISRCVKMQQPALHKLIDNLGTVSTATTLTMGATLLGRVSEEYKTKAQQKGWTLA